MSMSLIKLKRNSPSIELHLGLNSLSFIKMGYNSLNVIFLMSVRTPVFTIRCHGYQCQYLNFYINFIDFRFLYISIVS